MKINDVVFQNYQGIRRHGVVTAILKKDKWSYAKVKWFNDEKYETAMNFLTEMRGGRHYYDEYRIDKLVVLNPIEEIDSLKKCIKHIKKKKQ